MTREEAISVLKETIDPNVDKSFKEWKEWDKEKHLPAVNMAIEALRVEPVKHGEWVHEGVDYMTEQECWSRLPCFCSECKQETRAYFHNYCSNCGAKMDKE
jgi:hypothetical protein